MRKNVWNSFGVTWVPSGHSKSAGKSGGNLGGTLVFRNPRGNDKTDMFLNDYWQIYHIISYHIISLYIYKFWTHIPSPPKALVSLWFSFSRLVWYGLVPCRVCIAIIQGDVLNTSPGVCRRRIAKPRWQSSAIGCVFSYEKCESISRLTWTFRLRNLINYDLNCEIYHGFRSKKAFLSL